MVAQPDQKRFDACDVVTARAFPVNDFGELAFSLRSMFIHNYYLLFGLHFVAAEVQSVPSPHGGFDKT
jgi:hypothetical protein